MGVTTYTEAFHRFSVCSRFNENRRTASFWIINLLCFWIWPQIIVTTRPISIAFYVLFIASTSARSQTNGMGRLSMSIHYSPVCRPVIQLRCCLPIAHSSSKKDKKSFPGYCSLNLTSQLMNTLSVSGSYKRKFLFVGSYPTKCTFFAFASHFLRPFYFGTNA